MNSKKPNLSENPSLPPYHSLEFITFNPKNLWVQHAESTTRKYNILKFVFSIGPSCTMTNALNLSVVRVHRMVTCTLEPQTKQQIK